jgi:hypothetical protein
MKPDMPAFQNNMSLVEEKLLHPPPSERIEAALAHGIDLTLLIERLRKTPEERVRDLQRAINDLEAMRGRARPPHSTIDAEFNA